MVSHKKLPTKAKRTGEKASKKGSASSKMAPSPAAVAAALGPAPPGGPLEIVFSFDTTGSMSGVLAQVRRQVQDVISRLFADIPALRVAVFAHGDYCDSHTYVTKYIDFTNDVKKLCHFVETVKSTGGGDWEECYELVLKQTREQLSWTPGTQRSLVMIGDAIPHDTDYAMNKDNIDWEEETRRLYHEIGVRVYAVQAQNNSRATYFYEALADRTHGKKLNLEQFETIVDMMMAICYRETGPDMLEAFEREVRAREGAGIRAELDRMFGTLRDPAAGEPGTSSADEAVSASTSTVTATRGVKRGADDADDKTLKKLKGTAKKPMKAGLKRSSKGAAKKPWPMKKTSSGSIVAAGLVKKAKRMGRPRTAPVERSRREEVRQTNFCLNTLSWSPWKVAMTAKCPDGDADEWIPRRGADAYGFRKGGLFQNDSEKPAVYEFAVQTRQRCRRYPVYFSCTRGFSGKQWDTYLLKQNHLVNQVDNVLRKGCKLFARRAKVNRGAKVAENKISDVQELRRLIQKTYDYAWSRVPAARGDVRELSKQGIQLASTA